MVFIVVPETIYECPSCGTRIDRGKRKIGPKQVVCSGCKETIHTGWKEWQELTLFQKTMQVVGSIIVALCFGIVTSIIIGIGTSFAWYKIAGHLENWGGTQIIWFCIAWSPICSVGWFLQNMRRLVRNKL